MAGSFLRFVLCFLLWLLQADFPQDILLTGLPLNS